MKREIKGSFQSTPASALGGQWWGVGGSPMPVSPKEKRDPEGPTESGTGM